MEEVGPNMASKMGTMWLGGKRSFDVWISKIVSQVYAYVQTHKIANIKYVQMLVDQLY